MKRSSILVTVVLAVIVLGGFAWFFVEHQGRTSPEIRVRVGYLPIAAELPFFVAIEQGYFAERRIKVELSRFTSSNELANAATAGHVDVMAGTASNVIFDVGAVSGKKHKLLLLNPYSNAPGHITDYLLVKSDSPIKQLSGLRGQRIASFPGSVNRIFVNLILEKHGIPRDSYEYIELPPPNWQPALKSGAINAVSALEPTATQIVVDRVGRSIFDGFYADLMPDVPLSGHWISSDFAREADPETVQAFVAAYRKALDFIRKDEHDARKYLVKYANVRADILDKVGLNPWKMVDDVDVSHLQKFADLLFDQGALREKPDVKQYMLSPKSR